MQRSSSRRWINHATATGLESDQHSPNYLLRPDFRMLFNFSVQSTLALFKERKKPDNVVLLQVALHRVVLVEQPLEKFGRQPKR